MERKHYFLILGTVCLGLLVGSGVFALSGGQAEKFLVSKEAVPVSLTPLEEAQKDYAGVAITYQFGDQSESSTAAASSPGSEPMPTARSPLTRSSSCLRQRTGRQIRYGLYAADVPHFRRSGHHDQRRRLRLAHRPGKGNGPPARSPGPEAEHGLRTSLRPDSCGPRPSRLGYDVHRS